MPAGKPMTKTYPTSFPSCVTVFPPTPIRLPKAPAPFVNWSLKSASSDGSRAESAYGASILRPTDGSGAAEALASAVDATGVGAAVAATVGAAVDAAVALGATDAAPGEQAARTTPNRMTARTRPGIWRTPRR